MRTFISERKWFFIVLLLVVLALSWFLIHRSGNGLPKGLETGTVARGDVSEVVSETGLIQAARSVNLAFERSGRVSNIFVKEGDTVTAGDIIMILDTAAPGLERNVAEAQLEAEYIRLQELRSGADPLSLAINESTVLSAEQNLTRVTAQQNQLVDSAKQALYAIQPQAYLAKGQQENSEKNYTAPTVTGTYTGSEEGVYTITLYRSRSESNYAYRVSGLESMSHAVSTVRPTPVGTQGLYIQFPPNFAGDGLVWEIPIPNDRGQNHITSLNAYKNAVEGRELAINAAESALTTAKLQLQQVSGSARDERIALQEAQIKQMEARLSSSELALAGTRIIAPFDGTIHTISAEVGQFVSPGAPMVTLISETNFEVKVDVPEVDIAEVTVGDEAVITPEAFRDTSLKAKVTSVSPSSTLVNGVRVFTVTLNFLETDRRFRDGLSADVDITSATSHQVVMVPSRAVFENQTGRFVRVINTNNNIELRSVTTGLRGSNGYTEIVNGLIEGEHIITFANRDALSILEKNES